MVLLWAWCRFQKKIYVTFEIPIPNVCACTGFKVGSAVYLLVGVLGALWAGSRRLTLIEAIFILVGEKLQIWSRLRLGFNEFNYKYLWLSVVLTSILDPKITFTEQEAMDGASTENIIGGQTPLLTPYDLKRLESYAGNLVDYHLVISYSFMYTHSKAGGNYLQLVNAMHEGDGSSNFWSDSHKATTGLGL